MGPQYAWGIGLFRKCTSPLCALPTITRHAHLKQTTPRPQHNKHKLHSSTSVDSGFESPLSYLDRRLFCLGDRIELVEQRIKPEPVAVKEPTALPRETRPPVYKVWQPSMR
jgi:hypothetical protein